jgi:hypothetical protein
MTLSCHIVGLALLLSDPALEGRRDAVLFARTLRDHASNADHQD